MFLLWLAHLYASAGCPKAYTPLEHGCSILSTMEACFSFWKEPHVQCILFPYPSNTKPQEPPNSALPQKKLRTSKVWSCECIFHFAGKRWNHKCRNVPRSIQRNLINVSGLLRLHKSSMVFNWVLPITYHFGWPLDSVSNLCFFLLGSGSELGLFLYTCVRLQWVVLLFSMIESTNSFYPPSYIFLWVATGSLAHNRKASEEAWQLLPRKRHGGLSIVWGIAGGILLTT